MSEKTHKASAKRLQDAQEEGNVPRTESVPHLLAFCAVFELMAATRDKWLFIGPELLGSYITRVGTTGALRLEARDILLPLGAIALSMVILCLLVASVMALIGNVAQTGVVVATKGIARLDRLDPIAHVKQWFTAEQFQNLLMSIAKSGAIFGCCAVVCLMSLGSLMHAGGLTLQVGAHAVIDLAVKCERVALCLLLVFVLLDWFIRKRGHAEQLKMSREEVEREQKDQFGDRHVLQGRNEFRRDMLAGELVESTRKSTAVVTNPTHFAVAISYEPDKFPLPIVVARGRDEEAALMRRVAHHYGVPVIRSVQLARALYSTGRLNGPVPRVTLKAVAAVIGVVLEIRAGERKLTDAVELHDPIGDDPVR